jgi:hypothetical protein
MEIAATRNPGLALGIKLKWGNVKAFIIFIDSNAIQVQIEIGNNEPLAILEGVDCILHATNIRPRA